MKILIAIPVAVLALCAAKAWAGDDAGANASVSDNTAAMTTESVGGTTGGMSGSGALVGKTREQVYQELLRAQQDGTIDRMNAFYGGGN